MKYRNILPSPTGPFVTGAIDLMSGKDHFGNFMRLFYPSSYVDLSTKRDHWLPIYLGEEYVKGAVDFMVPVGLRYVSFTAADYFYRSSVLPCVWKSPLKKGKYPVIVFSHGLSGSRGEVGLICSEIASHGFIVAAMEHRDGSASASYYMDENNEKKWVLHKHLEKQNGSYKLRNQQLHIRTQEASSTLNAMEMINKGAFDTRINSDFNLSQFQNSLDLDNTIMAGFSFGGATALSTLAKDKRFKTGLVIDPWMYPLKDDATTFAMDTEQPILFLLNQIFNSEANLNAMIPYQNETNAFATLEGGRHLHQSDILFVLPPAILPMVGFHTSIDSYDALNLSKKCIMKFILEKLNTKPEWVEDYSNYLKNSKIMYFHPSGKARKQLGWSKKAGPRSAI